MTRGDVQRRLAELGDELAGLRSELRVAEEQLAALEEEADEARLRALVSETPLEARRHVEARRHAERMRRHRDSVSRAIGRLEHHVDELLDELSARQ